MSRRLDRVSVGPTLVGSAGLLCLAAFLILTIAVIQQRFDGLDRTSRSFVHQDQGPRLQVLMEGASVAGGQPGQLAVLGIGCMVLWRRRTIWALTLPLAMAGVGVVQFSAKWAMNRPRPNLHPWGFPSAHVLSLVVLCGLLAFMVGQTQRGRRWRLLAAGIAGGIVAIVAYSRMYLDAHWLSDVLGGFTAGLAYLLFVIWLMESAPGFLGGLRHAWRTSGYDGLPVPVAIAAAMESPIAPAVTPVAVSAPLGSAS
jgi:membrane-associated phospholipid phosphatase